MTENTMTRREARLAEAAAAQHSGYICKTCAGPSPVGIGYAAAGEAAALASHGRVSCDCGASVDPEAETLPGVRAAFRAIADAHGGLMTNDPAARFAVKMRALYERPGRPGHPSRRGESTVYAYFVEESDARAAAVDFRSNAIRRNKRFIANVQLRDRTTNRVKRV